jgi:hypothetical protein
MRQKPTATQVISHPVAQGTVLLLFGIAALAIKDSKLDIFGYVQFSIPVIFFEIYAAFSFFLSLLFLVAICSSKINSWLDEFLTTRPTSALKYLLWYTFISLYAATYLAAFVVVFAIGLISGVAQIKYAWLRIPLFILGIVWLVMIDYQAVRRWRHRNKKELTIDASKSRTESSLERAETRPFPKENTDVIYGLSMDRFRAQLQQIDSLDGKIGTLLGFGGVLLAILAAFVALMEGTIPGNTLALLCTSGAAYISIVVSSLYAYYTMRWESGPKLYEAWQNARTYNKKQLAWWVAESFTKSYENNQIKVRRKIWVVKLNVVLTIIQAIALALALIFIVLD